MVGSVHVETMETKYIVYGWVRVWLDWGWLGCFGLCGVDEIKQFILIQDIRVFAKIRF